MKKIVFINRFFYPDESATSLMLSDLAFYLSFEGVPVKVLTSRMRYHDAACSLLTHEEIRGVRIHRIWTTRFGRSHLLGRAFDYLSFYVSAFFYLIGSLKKGDVVVAKTDPPLISVVAMIAAKLKGARLVNWTQDIFPEVALALGVKVVKCFGGFFKWVRDLSLRAADANIAISEKMGQVLMARGIEASRVKVIHNWADGELISPTKATGNLLRKQWGLEGKFVVGYSGNMGRAHEFDTILEAVRSFSADAEIAFLFIGDGKQRCVIESACVKDNIRNISFKPYQPYERLGESLMVPDVHLISLKPELEGLIVPSKFYGIMAAGRPVLNIGSSAGEVAHWVRSIGCGYSVEPGCGAQLAGFIRELASHPEEARRLGRLGREYFEKNFNRPLALKAWYDVLGDLKSS